MTRNSVLFFRLSIMGSCIAGCHRPLAVQETNDPEGFPMRVETEKEDEGSASSNLLHERLVQHANRRAALHRTHIPVMETHAPTARGAEFDPFVERDCPPEGSATNDNQRQLNRLKNRTSEPTANDIDPDVTLDALRRRGADRDRWSTGAAATIEGFVRSAKGTGAESCNCKATDKGLTDTHLDIVKDAADIRQPVIAEITPVMRLIHKHNGDEDWSSPAIRAKYEGHQVRITGWLFFDEAHLYEADNTDPHDVRGNENWRSTCWEIHPITDIQVIDE